MNMGLADVLGYFDKRKSTVSGIMALQFNFLTRLCSLCVMTWIQVHFFLVIVCHGLYTKTAQEW